MIDGNLFENISILLENMYQREKQEKLASATIASDTLRAVAVSTDSIPQKCQALLQQANEHCTEDGLDIASLTLRHSRNLAEELDCDYEILKLKRKNEEIQRRIERNKVVIASLRADLESARQGLFAAAVNPRTAPDIIRQLRQKMASYEQSCDKAKTKFSKLTVPEALHPKSLDVLVSSLAALKVEEAQLKEKADDIVLARQLRDKFHTLRR